MSSPLYIAGVLVGLLGQFATNNIVAKVDGDEIALSALQDRAAQTRAIGGVPRADLLTDDLINEALMAREARARGLATAPEVVSAVESERRRVAAQLLEKDIAKTVHIDEQQLTDLFHKAADAVSLEEVILATEADARAALERLQKGASLAEEAKSSFDSTAAKNGGKMGMRNRGQLEDALADAAFAAPLNTFFGPVKLGVGWAVVRVVERQIGTAAELATRRDGLRQFAESQTRAQYRTHYVNQLRKQANVSIDEAFLRTTGTRLQASPADAAHVIATVGGTTIPYSDVVAEVTRLFGGSQSGHASGPAVKIEMSWSLVDRALLENAAIARGLGSGPEVRAKMAAAERDALVRRLAKDVRAAAADHADDAVRKMIADLRSHAQIQVNQDALARATGAQR